MRRQAFTRITLRGNVNCINNPTETRLCEQFIRPTYPPYGHETLLDIRCKSNRYVFIRTKGMNRVALHSRNHGLSILIFRVNTRPGRY